MQLKLKHLLNVLQKNDIKISSLKQIIKDGSTDVSVDSVMMMYKELGGIKDEIPQFEREWFILEPKTIIVLDESLHFNRYRNITLRSSLYHQLTCFPLDNYRRYCRNYEKECIKSGLQKGIWSNRESDFYFGASATPGDFFKEGSGGWKLRALQDYMEDMTAFSLKYKIIRFSVFDNFLAEGKLVRLDSILESENHPLQNQLLKYIMRRLSE